MFKPETKCRILGINYNTGKLAEAADHVIEERRALSGAYICFSNVHTTVTAMDDKEYQRVLNEAALVFPDGLPIARQEQKKGFTEAERIAGPDFMGEIFRRSAKNGISHYFYGAKQETLDRLRENLERNYPGIDIRGMYSPPFRELSDKEKEDDIDRINRSEADLIWIGLGAPKQEFFMDSVKGKVKGVMLGVGAGFDFHAGTVKRAPVVLQRLGLEWLYRLCQDPGRLMKRYLVTNTRFLWSTRVLKK